jgi:hypothetical protein
MTKKLIYQGLFKSNLLADELLAAFPSWGGVTSEGTSRMQSKPDESEVYLFVPDAADEGEIQVVIDAHDPDALSIGEQRQAHRDDARARFLLSQLANKTPQQIHTQMQGAIDGWSSLADARADLREWLPLITAVIAWKVID